MVVPRETHGTNICSTWNTVFCVNTTVDNFVEKQAVFYPQATIQGAGHAFEDFSCP
jgi:hypothetical protein